ncbi:ThuA domain-containing protein [Candidatus Poribacteria bacterium]|nr:ThuA domain-containing protein [Candidatus Poribacteria bacterium]
MAHHVAFLIGENEYKSERTMPPVAHELVTQYGMSTSVLIAKPELTTLPGLDALAEADLVVTYLRFIAIPKLQLDKIQAYLDSRKPIVGLRTSTHSFRYPDDSPHKDWNMFGDWVYGTPWKFHYGGGSTTDVTVIPEKAHHPILTGVDRAFHCRSWLYYVYPLPDDCEYLMMGKSVGESHREDREDNPVAWTRSAGGRRTFYTSLGHPEDFEVPAFRKLLINGIFWALGEPAPTS